MFGTLIGSGIAACFIYGGMKWRPKEVIKIQHVFRNIKYKAGDKEPKLIRTDKKEGYTDYIFSVPYGLVDNPNLQPVLQKTLIKPVTVYFRGKLIIRVHKNSLPNRIDYKLIKTDTWNVPVGQSLEGMIYHDFDKLQHLTIAGASQWGKTSFIKMIITNLIENHPNEAEFYLLDLKGMLSFNKYTNLKQIKGTAGNYEESVSILKEVEKDIIKTIGHFKKGYFENINETNIKARKFIVIDEAGELVPKKGMNEDDKNNLKECQRIISYIVRVSAALGFRLIYGTQYPTADIMDNQIKANASARISFRLQTSIQSKVAIDEAGAENLPCPGRAIYKTVDSHEVQVPYITSKEMERRLQKHEINKPKDEQVRNNTIEFG